ncbi:unnamed protein product [Closterium sp. NIES-53]
MIALCQEHRLEHRTKHIALRYFLARELQQLGQFRLAYVATRANTADIFTKALQSGDHQRFCTVLGLLALFFLTGLVTTCSPPLCLWGTKHIALRYFLARELQQRGQLRLAYVASEANTADIFTKALAPGDHQRFCTMLACFALLDWSCDLLFSPTLPMGVFLLVPNSFASSSIPVSSHPTTSTLDNPVPRPPTFVT